jgi:hypothetical protein
VVPFRPHRQQLHAAIIAHVCLHLWRWARGPEVLHRTGRLDWDSIEPSSLGTLFERSLDPSKRAQLGAHYTSREDILAVVEPVLAAPLRGRWAEVRELAEKLVEKRVTASGGPATRINNDLSRLLSRFAEQIASVRVLDPACGSGNFLGVSMHNLLNSSRLPAPTTTISVSCTRGRTNRGQAGWEPRWAWATIFATNLRRASRRSRCRGRRGKTRKAIRESGRSPRPPAASTNSGATGSTPRVWIDPPSSEGEAPDNGPTLQVTPLPSL